MACYRPWGTAAKLRLEAMVGVAGQGTAGSAGFSCCQRPDAEIRSDAEDSHSSP